MTAENLEERKERKQRQSREFLGREGLEWSKRKEEVKKRNREQEGRLKGRLGKF